MNNCRKQNSTPLPLAQVAVGYLDMLGTAHFVWSSAGYAALGEGRKFQITNNPAIRYRREVPLSC